MTAAANATLLTSWPEMEYEVSVTIPGRAPVTVLSGVLPRALVDDVLADPARYVHDADAHRVELWIEPSGWNEGFDRAATPKVTAFVASAQDADHIARVVAAHQSPHPWTDFAVRTSHASTRAPMSGPAQVITEMMTWIDQRSAEYIP